MSPQTSSVCSNPHREAWNKPSNEASDSTGVECSPPTLCYKVSMPTDTGQFKILHTVHVRLSLCVIYFSI